MKTLLKTLIPVLLFVCQISGTSAAHASGNGSLGIIPAPTEVIQMEGAYTFPSFDVFIENSIYSDRLMEMLKCKLEAPTGLDVVPASAKKANLRFVEDPSQPVDGYSLTVGKKGVTVSASSYGGHFYGFQTLLQLLPVEIKSLEAVSADWTVPFVEIKDSPRFPWRGLMLDVSRHWFTKEEVMKYIDELAEYKFNIFHWHLTDDQGWRIQIESCPELTGRGAMRASRIGGDWWNLDPPHAGEPLDYGGFYTKEDVREVIEYAAKRNVSVMPEIDVPGHSTAALVAYPELACFKAPEYVNVGQKFYGVEENALCPGNEKTFEILEKVFREIAEMFPFEYIDIGGDECFRGFWEKCPKCAGRMEEEHLTDVAQLQSYFIKRVEKIIESYGKKIVGWDEILDGGLADNATVMSWRGMDGGIKAAKAGHKVIMTPTSNCYLDLYQGEPSAEPVTYSMLRLSTCYDFEPVPEGIDPSLVLGGQGNLWGEAVPVFRHAEYMTWPRGWALSEVFWSRKDKRDWMDFVGRMEHHFLRAGTADINCSFNSVYNAIVSVKKCEDGNLSIELGSELDDVELYYTFDNTNPDSHSIRYTAPFSMPESSTRLRIQSYRNGRKVGDMICLTLNTLKARATN